MESNVAGKSGEVMRARPNQSMVNGTQSRLEGHQLDDVGMSEAHFTSSSTYPDIRN